MELYVEEEEAQKIIDVSKSFNIDAQIIGRVEASEQKQVTVKSEHGEFEYKD
jgi:phosphoribosylformylglycinamidine cyclo-ligase